MICSTALRTRQTLDGLGLDAQVDFESRVYGGDAGELLDVLREQGGSERLLLIGHNPSTHQLVLDLTGGDVPSFPTSAMAVIEFDGGWDELSDGRLTQLWTPRT